MKKRMLLAATALAAMAIAPQFALAQTSQQPSNSQATQGKTDDAQVVVITGYRSSLDAAQKTKRRSGEVVEAIAPEDLGKFADVSIADELQRVPGVQIDRGNDGRSGDHVSIRGMGAEYITTTINGREIGGYGSQGATNLREFAVDVFPTDVLNGTQIYKTSNAELIESGLGGEVNFNTLRPLDYKSQFGNNFFGTISVKESSNNSTSRDGYTYSGLIGGKFLNNTLGVYVGGLTSTNPFREDFVEVRSQLDTVNVANAAGAVTQQNVIYPSYPDFGMMRRDDKRQAFYADIQWRPNANLEVNLDYLDSVYDRPDNRDYSTVTSYDGGNILSGVFKPGGITIQNGVVTGLNFADYTPPARGASSVDVNDNPLLYNMNDRLQTLGANVAWHKDRLAVQMDASYGAVYATYDIGVIIPAGVPYPDISALNYTANSSGPASFNVGAPVFDQPSDFSQIAGNYQGLGVERNDTAAFKIDVSFQANDNITYKTGIRIADESVDVRYASTYVAYTASQSAQLQPILYPGGVDNIFQNFSGFGLNQQPVQNPAGTFAYSNAFMPVGNLKAEPFSGSFFGSINAGGPWSIDPGQSHANQERTAAAYVQADFDTVAMSLPVTGNFGLRVVNTDEEAKAFQGVEYVDANFLADQPSITVPVRTDHSYLTWLPAANIALHLDSDTNLRLAVTRTLSRPEFEDMSPINSLVVPDPALGSAVAGIKGSGNVGNGLLDPETAWNFDVTWERYFPNGFSYVLSAFDKQVSNFIAPTTIYNTPEAGFGSQLFSVSTYENVGGGESRGFEAGFDLPFKVISASLSGFGAEGNFTYVSSRIGYDFNGRHYAFPGASPYNANASFYYEKGPLGAHLSFVYRSNYVSQLASLGGLPIYTDSTLNVDASGSYKINQHLELTVTATNLTGQNRRDYFYNSRNFENYYTVPKGFAVALRYKF